MVNWPHEKVTYDLPFAKDQSSPLTVLTHDKSVTTKNYSYKFTVTIHYSHPNVQVPLYFFIEKKRKKEKKKRVTNTESLKSVHTITKSRKQLVNTKPQTQTRLRSTVHT